MGTAEGSTLGSTADHLSLALTFDFSHSQNRRKSLGSKQLLLQPFQLQVLTPFACSLIEQGASGILTPIRAGAREPIKTVVNGFIRFDRRQDSYPESPALQRTYFSFSRHATLSIGLRRLQQRVHGIDYFILSFCEYRNRQLDVDYYQGVQVRLSKRLAFTPYLRRYIVDQPLDFSDSISLT